MNILGKTGKLGFRLQFHEKKSNSIKTAANWNWFHEKKIQEYEKTRLVISTFNGFAK